jgi:ArsR family transcriptional regulator
MQLVPDELVEQVAQRFRVLSEPARLRLLNLLQAHGEQSVQALVAGSGLQQANVSKHLALMAGTGLLARRRDGLSVYYRLADPTLLALCTLVAGQLQQRQPSG